MDTTLRGLIDAIIEKPDDIILRLICADRFEELEESVECLKCGGDGMTIHEDFSGILNVDQCLKCGGDGHHSNGMKARADFIRAQCESPNADQYQAGRSLLLDNYASWAPRLSETRTFEIVLSTKWLPTKHAACAFRHGFISWVVCTMADWERHGPDICRDHPIGRVAISDKDPEFRTWDSISGNPYIFWSDADLTRSITHTVPRRFFGHLDNASHKLFPDRISAFDWLSARCIAWAMSQAPSLASA